MNVAKGMYKFSTDIYLIFLETDSPISDSQNSVFVLYMHMLYRKWQKGFVGGVY